MKSAIAIQNLGWYHSLLDEYRHFWMNKWSFIHILHISSIVVDVNSFITLPNVTSALRKRNRKNREKKEKKVLDVKIWNDVSQTNSFQLNFYPHYFTSKPTVCPNSIEQICKSCSTAFDAPLPCDLDFTQLKRVMIHNVHPHSSLIAPSHDYQTEILFFWVSFVSERGFQRTFACIIWTRYEFLNRCIQN